MKCSIPGEMSYEYHVSFEMLHFVSIYSITFLHIQFYSNKNIKFFALEFSVELNSFFNSICLNTDMLTYLSN